ncbi:glycosyltransferase [uncultured Desulfovibrio sp.]|uniref:glycosyltransferase family 2 protein n=1 Tax=uncultured Desulfovibrio sp. TaxID=167968 RepID=UPI002729B9E2|nr:glycosyltransferase [uncultured Desulfovibrio sp.]
MNTEFHPLVSIVIPVYNGSNYLREAIDSALAQTYDNIEILVINDGSNDNGATEAIAKSYGDKIRYFSKENGGVATALNMGIENMRGEYFSWLSHDDVYESDKIKVNIEFLNCIKNKNTVLFSNYKYINEYGDVIYTSNLSYTEARCNLNYGFYDVLFGKLSGCTLLIAKELLDIHKGFNEKLRFTQDYDLWFRLFKEDEIEIKFLEDILVQTRFHPVQDSRKQCKAQQMEIFNLWRLMISSLDREKCEKIGLSKLYILKQLHDDFFYHLKDNFNYFKIFDYVNSEIKKYASRKKYVGDYLVSVIIPFFNRIEYTIDAIKSVQRQSYNNIEIIIVDDYSTERIDNLLEFIKYDDRIKYIKNNQSKGVSSARNIGMSFASGEYLAFLDNDDLFYENKIEYQLYEMVQNDLNFTYTDYIRFDDLCNEEKMRLKKSSSIKKAYGICISTVMISKKLYKKYKFIDINIAEDICYFLEISQQFYLINIPKFLTKFRVHNGSHFKNNKSQLIGIINLMYFQISHLNYNRNLSYLNSDIYNLYSLIDDCNIEDNISGKKALKIVFKKIKRKLSKFINNIIAN